MRGRVYLWAPDRAAPLGGRVAKTIVPLPHLERDGVASGRLSGRYVRVRNGGQVNEPDPETGGVRAVPVGDACPDGAGDFLFEPGRGGGRIDKVELAEPDFRWRYLQAAHFGEVNTYFHLDRIASYVDELLRELGAASLPRVTAVVNAHHAATVTNGERDGVPGRSRLIPFQGGHYRLPARRYGIPEREAISEDGEIHLGPGFQLVVHGALPAAAGGRYRANASHNAGIIYHEYGHHITRHTADFSANALGRPDRQRNCKSAVDEAMSDYWAAMMLDTPHIWAFHKRHAGDAVHPRSLASTKTMRDYVRGPGAEVHSNGTIFAAALWDLRERVRAAEPDGARTVDRLLLRALIAVGSWPKPCPAAKGRDVRRVRQSFGVALAALVRADELLHGGRHREIVVATFAARGIRPAPMADREVSFSTDLPLAPPGASEA